MNPPTEQLIRDYLNRLSVAARSRLGDRQRQELLDGTRASIEASVGGTSGATMLKVRRVLADLGDPIALVEREWARFAGSANGGPVMPGDGTPPGDGTRSGDGTPSSGGTPASEGTRAGDGNRAGQAMPGGHVVALPEPVPDCGAAVAAVRVPAPVVSLPVGQAAPRGGAATTAVAAGLSARGEVAAAVDPDRQAGHWAVACTEREHRPPSAAGSAAGSAAAPAAGAELPSTSEQTAWPPSPTWSPPPTGSPPTGSQSAAETPPSATSQPVAETPPAASSQSAAETPPAAGSRPTDGSQSAGSGSATPATRSETVGWASPPVRLDAIVTASAGQQARPDPAAPSAVIAMPMRAGGSAPGEVPLPATGESPSDSRPTCGSASGLSSAGSVPASAGPGSARGVSAAPLPRQVPQQERIAEAGSGQDAERPGAGNVPVSPGAVVAIFGSGTAGPGEAAVGEEAYEGELVYRPADRVRQARDVAARRLAGPAQVLARQARDVAGPRLAGSARVLARQAWRIGGSLLALAMRDKLETLVILLLGIGGAVYPPVWIAGAILALVSPKWDMRDKLLGLALPVMLVIFGAVLVVALGGVRVTMAQYGFEGWLAAGRLARVGAVVGAGYLLGRIYRGKRPPRQPPWNRPPAGPSRRSPR